MIDTKDFEATDHDSEETKDLKVHASALALTDSTLVLIMLLLIVFMLL